MWPSVRPEFALFPPTSQLDVWSRKPDPLSPSFEAMCVPCSQWLNRPRRPWMAVGDAVPRLSRDSRWRRAALLPAQGKARRKMRSASGSMSSTSATGMTRRRLRKRPARMTSASGRSWREA
jgi:hypothetical protein